MRQINWESIVNGINGDRSFIKSPSIHKSIRLFGVLHYLFYGTVNIETMILNLNIGILGHVDSGKTSLAKCLSDIASTASFDKNPQSQERCITLDLGIECCGKIFSFNAILTKQRFQDSVRINVIYPHIYRNTRPSTQNCNSHSSIAQDMPSLYELLLEAHRSWICLC